MFRSFILEKGYAETSHFAVILLYHPKGFQTRKEGLKSIQEALKETWK